MSHAVRTFAAVFGVLVALFTIVGVFLFAVFLLSAGNPLGWLALVLGTAAMAASITALVEFW